MPRQSWTGFYLIWAVAFAVCAILVLAPTREPNRQAAAPAAPYVAAPGQRSSTRAGPLSTEPVWVNTRSHVYHYPGQRWYGHTIQGKYMKEADAIAEGDRATQNGQ